MTKNYVELRLRADPYQMISDAVESGLQGGFNRFVKHIDSPLTELQEEQMFMKQHEYIMSAISDLMYHEEEE